MAPLRLQSGTTRGVVALKNGLNGSKLAAFALYTEHSHTTVPKLSVFNADHIGYRGAINFARSAHENLMKIVLGTLESNEWCKIRDGVFQILYGQSRIPFGFLPDRERVEWVSTDMWRPFKRSFRPYLPNAGSSSTSSTS